MKKRYLALGALGAAAIGAVSWGVAANDVEQPGYKVLTQSGAIEIREYDAMIVAEAFVEGEREQAMNQGFRIIADYIFGNNIAKQSVAMTSPVTQQSNAKIAMTSPVTQQPTGGSWQVRFIMPSQYTMDTLPVPVNPQVQLLEIPARKVAAIRFSGRGRKAALQAQEADLRAYLTANNLKTLAEPTYAFYDGPWVSGPMRRNEVMLEMAAD